MSAPVRQQTPEERAARQAAAVLAAAEALVVAARSVEQECLIWVDAVRQQAEADLGVEPTDQAVLDRPEYAAALDRLRFVDDLLRRAVEHRDRWRRLAGR